MNPALPLEFFVPDPEPRLWQDGRVHVYGSYDISGEQSYCSREYHAFSSTDLIHWERHGRSFSTSEPGVGDEWQGQTLYAPDCAWYRNMYHLFFCTSSKGEGVATSTSPFGPFSNARVVRGAHGDAIDPAIFIDDDETPYLYWGQFNARGAQLTEDLSGIVVSTENRNLINEADHGFHEGPSMRKRNGIYYLIYSDISRGRPTCLSYATSSNPLGPFTKRGVIIDNTGCDPETWNNHGSIVEFEGQWYVFYHRSSQGTRFSRRMCIEPIKFNDDGSIDEVEMTTQGVEGPLDPYTTMEASRACTLTGGVRAQPSPSAKADEECLTLIGDGNSAAYRYFDFTAPPKSCVFDVSSIRGGGSIEIRVGTAQGELLGTCEPPASGNSTKPVVCDTRPITGRHAIWLVFKGNGKDLFDLSSFAFTRR